MTEIPFAQIDAFADRPFTGNPAAVMPLDAWLDDATLQAIAAENNLAETAFLVPDEGGAADHELRWFTPTVEVDLCGHATLASGHYVLSRQPELGEVRFATRRAGVLRVARDGDGYALDLPALPTSPRAMPDMAGWLGAEPQETQWRDGGYALFVFRDEAEIRALDPDVRAMAAAGVVTFICTAPGLDTDIVSRVFVPGAGIDEDPVTGAAHAVLTPYWAARLGRAEFTAFQASTRGGRLTCRIDGDRAVLSGRCVTVIEGVFRL